MYGSVLPSYNSEKKDENKNTIKADDPKNKDVVRNLMFG